MPDSEPTHDASLRWYFGWVAGLVMAWHLFAVFGEESWLGAAPTVALILIHSDHSALPADAPSHILNHMVQFRHSHFDAAFGALADPTRRGVLEQLGREDASITALAERFNMTLTGMKKHVGVLEQAGLVTTEKVGRVRTCRLGRRGLQEEAAWIEQYRQLWSARFDELDHIVDELQRKENANARKQRK